MKIRCGTDILRVSRIENIKNLDKDDYRDVLYQRGSVKSFEDWNW